MEKGDIIDLKRQGDKCMKSTRIYKMSENLIDANAIRACADIIRRGGLVVFPTETVYGIGCNAYNEEAIKRLYEAKERPANKPLLAHLYSISQAEDISYLDTRSRKLIKKYTPGPLTLIVRKKIGIPDIMTSGEATVGLRFPSNPVGLAFMQECGVPIAATSANISGNGASITGEDAARELMGRVDAIIDCGPSSIGVASTIVSMIGKPKILREGAFDKKELDEILSGQVFLVGICGKSGSGKGLVSSYLRKTGYTVVDTDSLYHAMISNPISECTTALAKEFGPDVRNLQGGIDRDVLRSIVFNDKKKLERLNKISHEYVAQRVENIVANHGSGEIVFVDAPLLYESGISDKCSAVICVTADDDMCVARITERDGISAVDARKRLALQPDYASRADICIENRGSEEELIGKVEAVINKLKEMSGDA